MFVFIIIVVSIMVGGIMMYGAPTIDNQEVVGITVTSLKKPIKLSGNSSAARTSTNTDNTPNRNSDGNNFSSQPVGTNSGNGVNMAMPMAMPVPMPMAMPVPMHVNNRDGATSRSAHRPPANRGAPDAPAMGYPVQNNKVDPNLILGINNNKEFPENELKTTKHRKKKYFLEN